MARTDLTEDEIRELTRWATQQEPRKAQLVQRLAGEVRQLRERESQTRFLHQLEGEY